MTRLYTVRIAECTDEAVDIRSFLLESADGEALPTYAPGAHIDVHLPGGPVRPYSLCNGAEDAGRYRIAVLKAPASRGGSVAMHLLAAGQVLTIGEPRNHFPLLPGARHSVLLAGGIGITPILAMAEGLWAADASFSLHYCTRSAERTAFAGRIRRSPFAGQVAFHHDDGIGAPQLDAREAIGPPAEGSHLYVCGPTGFMDMVLATARDLGWPEAALHREYFAAAPTMPAGETGAFEVQLATSGRVIRVAADQSVVAALAAADVKVPVSCEQGVCGACVTTVLEGTPDHRDLYLTDDEHARGDRFTPCCSRSLSPRLVLDL